MILTIKKELKIIGASLCIGVIVTVIFGLFSSAYSKNLEMGLAESVIRFHVIANSDSDHDQAIKLKVRDEVLKNLPSSASRDEAMTYINANISKIEQVANSVLEQNGQRYRATASLEAAYFPTKQYGDLQFPPGEYTALRIKLGEADGKNWWCVMFPPLCFVDATKTKVSQTTKDKLQTILSEDEYKLISKSDKIEYKFRFKIVEMWQQMSDKNKP